MDSKIIAVAVILIPGFSGMVSASEESTFDRRTPVVKVYQNTHKAVVNIAGERLVSSSAWPGYDWPDVFDFWGPRYQRQVAVLGSGMVVHEDGYVITNAHVIKGSEKIKVVFSDGSEYQAQIISGDESKDLAVLKIPVNKKLPFVRLGRSNDLMIGETVVAIGNPYGYANTVTSGVISAVGRDIQVAEDFWLRGLIQTDAPINPGNSGGPLLNINGELIGVNTAVRAEAENIGFAIPVDMLVDNLSHMLMPEKLRRVRLGLAMGRMKKIGAFSGLVVDSVSKTSPADQQGISAGDLILEIDGRKLTSVIDFYVKMMDKEIGQPIQVTYVKSSSIPLRSRTVKLTMKPRPLPDGRKLVSEFFQMEVSELTDRIARKFDFQGAYPILIITDIECSGIADRAGLAPGDLILQINNATVRNVRELSLEMEKINEGDAVDIQIMRIRIGIFGQVQQRYKARLTVQSIKSGEYIF
ncbi:MAG: trypsin-like peptidase domain-containing protein [Planctomycetota bacterium]|jgi:serine protease Do